MSEVVRRYYDRNVEKEWERLSKPYRRLEYASTLRLIDDHFPPSGRVLDVGSGPGRYTLELARRGYRVTLVDLSAENVRFASQRLEEAGLTVDAARQADACNLKFLPSASFDAALLLGPLYHLVKEDDRKAALEELRRVLQPGAPAVVGFLNPWGILRSGLSEFPQDYRDEPHVRELLATWAQEGEGGAFTEAAFLTPPQALAELRANGFAVEACAGAEGFAAGMLDQVERIAQDDPAAYEVILHLAADTCDHPAYWRTSEHLHVVVRAIPRSD